MHATAAESANRLLREEHFREMKKTASYISTAASTTDSAQIKEHRGARRRRLDVLEQEPPGNNNPLLKQETPS